MAIKDFNQTFKRSEWEDVELNEDRLEEGEHLVQISGVTLEPNAKKTGINLRVIYESAEGGTAWEYFVMRHDTSMYAQTKGRKELAQLMAALGLDTLKNAEELMGHKLVIALGYEDDSEYLSVLEKHPYEEKKPASQSLRKRSPTTREKPQTRSRKPDPDPEPPTEDEQEISVDDLDDDIPF